MGRFIAPPLCSLALCHSTGEQQLRQYSSSQELQSWAGTRALCPSEGTVSAGLVLQVLSRTKSLLLALVGVWRVSQLCQSTGRGLQIPLPCLSGNVGCERGESKTHPRAVGSRHGPGWGLCVSSTKPCPHEVCDSALSVSVP